MNISGFLKRIYIYIFILLNMLSPNSFAQGGISNLKKELTNFKNDEVLKHSNWGFVIKNTVTDSVLLSYNEQQALIPASTLKVLTTATSLESLGEKFQYKTLLKYSGEIKNDTLKGNVYIIGSGDPTLDSYLFLKDPNKSVIRKWVNDLNKAGIKSIKGSVIAVDDCFDDAVTPENWLWTDMGNYYGAGPVGLNFMDNKFAVHLRSGKKIGDPVSIVSVVPEIQSLDLINEVKTAAKGTGDKTFIYGSEFNNQRIVRGTIPLNRDSFEIEGSLPDAALFCAQTLHQNLNNFSKNYTGVDFSSRIYRFAGNPVSIVDSAITVDTVYSPYLSDIVHFTNLKSNNLYAESLLKTLSLNKNGIGTTSGGIKIVESFCRSVTDISGLRLFDGSGLSPMNRITPNIQCNVMVYIAKQKYFDIILSSFPIAGKTGSLANICKDSPAEGKIFAKSGYIEGVRAYTGYVKNKKGEWLAFSFIVNNYDCTPFEIKKKMEKIFIAMAQL